MKKKFEFLQDTKNVDVAFANPPQGKLMRAIQFIAMLLVWIFFGYIFLFCVALSVNKLTGVVIVTDSNFLISMSGSMLMVLLMAKEGRDMLLDVLNPIFVVEIPREGDVSTSGAWVTRRDLAKTIPHKKSVLICIPGVRGVAWVIDPPGEQVWLLQWRPKLQVRRHKNGLVTSVFLKDHEGSVLLLTLDELRDIMQLPVTNLLHLHRYQVLLTENKDRKKSILVEREIVRDLRAQLVKCCDQIEELHGERNRLTSENERLLFDTKKHTKMLITLVKNLRESPRFENNVTARWTAIFLMRELQDNPDTPLLIREAYVDLIPLLLASVGEPFPPKETSAKKAA